MPDYTIKELMACWLSRDLADGEWVGVGANFPIPRAAGVLAHLNHGPNMTVSMGAFRANLLGVDKVMTARYFSDFRLRRWGESTVCFPIDIFCFHKLDVFFVGGLQIDAYGNTNLIGLPGEGKKFKLRGPGSIGTPTLAAVARRYYIVAENHNPRVFVEKCSLISAMGYGDGASGLRKKLNLPGSGPRYCVTSLCVFDFHPETNRMRLRSLHPGVSLDQVLEATGFKPELPEEIPETEPPTERELEILRRRVDPEGVLRS